MGLEHETLYTAVLAVVKKLTLVSTWRVVIESNVRIVLERRTCREKQKKKSEDNGQGLCFFNGILLQNGKQVANFNTSETVDENKGDIWPFIKEEPDEHGGVTDSHDSGGEWGSSPVGHSDIEANAYPPSPQVPSFAITNPSYENTAFSLAFAPKKRGRGRPKKQMGSTPDDKDEDYVPSIKLKKTDQDSDDDSEDEDDETSSEMVSKCPNTRTKDDSSTNDTATNANASKPDITTIDTSSGERRIGKRLGNLLQFPRGSYNKQCEDGMKKGSKKNFKYDKKPCPICKTSVYRNQYLDAHMKKCHSNFLSPKEKVELESKELAERTCQICKKIFKLKGSLAVHMKEIHIRDTVEERTCNYCGKLLSSRRRREEHIAALHETDRVGGPYPCDLCSKLFGTKEQLHRHRKKTCSKIQIKASCPVCNKFYRDSQNLRFHLLTEHSDQYEPENEEEEKLLRNEKVTCHICGKDMRRLSLKQHILFVHQQEKRVPKCGICHLCFPSDSLKRKHLKLIHGISPKLKKCEVCGKGFINGESLKKHIKGVHQGFRHQCPHCISSFFARKDLKDHINSVHLGNKHLCNICPKEFNRRSELNRHKKKVHNVDPSTNNTLPDSPKKLVIDTQFITRTIDRKQINAFFPNLEKPNDFFHFLV